MSDTTEQTQWYIARDGQQHGPLSEPEMQLFVKGGHLKPTDLIWRPGFSDWRPAPMVFPPKSETETESTKKPAAARSTISRDEPVRRETEPQTDTSGKPASRREPVAKTDNLSARIAAKQAPGTSAPGSIVPGGPAGSARTKGDTVHPTLRAGDPAPASSQQQPRGPSEPMAPGDGAQKHRQPGPGGADLGPRLENVPGGAPGRQFGSGGGRPSAGQTEARDLSARPAADTGPSGKSSGASQLEATQADRSGPSSGGNGSGGPGSTPAKKTMSMRRLLTGAAILAFVGGGAYLGLKNREQLSDIAVSMFKTGSQTAEQPPVVEANKDVKTATPAPTPAPAPAPAPSPAVAPPMDGIITTVPSTASPTPAPAPDNATLAALDAEFQKSPLWSLLKAEYPEWYNARLQEVIALNAAGDDPEVTKRLLAEIVTLRRKHTNEALSASKDSLLEVATAFLANLKKLEQHSTGACYAFISKGELSPDVLNLMSQKGFAPTLETHATAIFKAISNGRTSPVQREKANKQDYGILARQLAKQGWKEDDFKLFANPEAFDKAPPERVCKMIQDWYAAQIALADAGAQERLLYDNLRPVIAR